MSIGDIALAVGNFSPRSQHSVGREMLEPAIADFEAIATTFAVNVIQDDAVRTSYLQHIREVSDQVRAEVARGALSAKAGAEYCSALRDALFKEYRKFTSAVGVARAEQKKMTARGLDYYLNKYALSDYGVKFSDLTERQRGVIYYKILQKAGGGNVGVTVEVRRLQVLAKVLILFSAMLAAGEIAFSDQKLKELSRQGSIIAGGLVGGYAAGLSASFLCGPAEPMCAAVVVALGSYIGGSAGEKLDAFYQEELEVFLRWLK